MINQEAATKINSLQSKKNGKLISNYSIFAIIINFTIILLSFKNIFTYDLGRKISLQYNSSLGLFDLLINPIFNLETITFNILDLVFIIISVISLLYLLIENKINLNRWYIRLYMYLGELINILLWTGLLGRFFYYLYQGVSYSQCYECDDFAGIAAFGGYILFQILILIVFSLIYIIRRNRLKYREDLRKYVVLNHIFIQLILLIWLFFINNWGYLLLT